MSNNPFDASRDSAALRGAAFDDETRSAESEHDGFGDNALGITQAETDMRRDGLPAPTDVRPGP